MAKFIPLPCSCGKPTYCKKLPGFSPPCQDVARISLSAIIFLFQLDSSILCLHNVFVTYDLLGFTLELFDTFHLWSLFNYLSYVFLYVFSSSCNSMSCSWCKTWRKKLWEILGILKSGRLQKVYLQANFSKYVTFLLSGYWCLNQWHLLNSRVNVFRKVMKYFLVEFNLQTSKVA